MGGFCASMELLCHINADEDLLDSWLAYYEAMGISAFHLIVHGSAEENRRLLDLRTKHSILIRDVYEGEFRSEEKQRRINAVLPTLEGRWLLLVDSDEFVELPYDTLAETTRMLDLLGADVLHAPLLQRLTVDGRINTPERIEDPFRTFPLCSVDLCGKMGVRACLDKYPLFWCRAESALYDGGNHHPPNGPDSRLSSLRGVTHHFKWRSAVLQRLDARVNSGHTWRHESMGYQQYLETVDYLLPLDGSFPYSREELFRRDLLKKAVWKDAMLPALKNHARALPAPARRVARTFYHALQRTHRAAPQNSWE